MTPWLVQKYGGTSVGKKLHAIVHDIVPSFLATHRVALVCSARSGSSKAGGTTSLLLQAAHEALQPVPQLSGYTSGANTPSSSWPSLRPADANSSFAFDKTLQAILDDHLAAADEYVSDHAARQQLCTEIRLDVDLLRSFLGAATIIDEISPRSKDIIVSVGERLSCRIVTAALKDRGVDAELVILDNIVDRPLPPEDDLEDPEEPSSASESLPRSWYTRLSKKIAHRIAECEDRVPVITGFFGPVPGSLLQQVGRGYTDLCAALLSIALPDCHELQIWKEVDGIFTADPRKVSTARLLPLITPEEAAELTFYGSEVIHPFTMDWVIKKGIPIRIKNVMDMHGSGTVIYPDSASSTRSNSPDVVPPVAAPAPSIAIGRPAHLSSLRHPRGLPTAITSKDKIIILNVRSNRKTISQAFFARIFGTLDKYNIAVDLISTSEVSVSMAVEKLGFRTSLLEKVERELRKIGEVTVKEDMAILSLLGNQMKNNIGIAGKMFTTIAEANINLEMISQGASEINISCVIDGKDVEKALNVVHHKLLVQPLAADLTANHPAPF